MSQLMELVVSLFILIMDDIYIYWQFVILVNILQYIYIYWQSFILRIVNVLLYADLARGLQDFSCSFNSMNKRTVLRI